MEFFVLKEIYESANDLQADMDQHNRNARSNRTSYLLLLDIFKIFLWISILKSKVCYAHFHYVLSFYHLGDNNISEKIPNSVSIVRLHIPSGLNVIYFCKYIWNHEFISI